MMNNYAYITFLTSDDYLLGVELLKGSLDRVGSKYPLYCCTIDSLSDETFAALDRANINQIPVKLIETPEAIMNHNMALNERQALIWKYVLTKFQAWTLEQFDKIILLDCDIAVLKNIDHCFDMPHLTAALDGEYFNLWPTWPHFNSGFMVIKPSFSEFVSICAFAKMLDPKKYKDATNNEYLIADQEILNIYYKDWVSKKELHLNKYYNVFAPHASKLCAKDIIENAYFIHYVGAKPWKTDLTGKSILLSTDHSNTVSKELYAYANSILNIFHNSMIADENVDWAKTEISGLFDCGVALMLNNTYNDFENALYYANRAQFKDPSNEDYKKLIDGINKCQLSVKHRDLIVPLIRQIYEETVNNGCPSLMLFKDLTFLTSMNEETVLNTSDMYWNFIVNSLMNAIKTQD